MATTQGERILVVDDNEINRDLLRRRLSKVGFLIDEADGYTTAMERMALHTPDLILLDIMMPEIKCPGHKAE